MTEFEIAERYKLSLRKVRQLMADGIISADLAADPELAEIRHTLSRGQPLTVLHLCRLVSDPSSVKALGKHQAKALDQLKECEGVPVAPLHIAACIDAASRNSEEEIEALGTWIAATFVKASYRRVAVGLLMGLPPVVRKSESKRLSLAVHRVRQASIVTYDPKKKLYMA